jgi:hypothetical protein
MRSVRPCVAATSVRVSHLLDVIASAFLTAFPLFSSPAGSPHQTPRRFDSSAEMDGVCTKR